MTDDGERPQPATCPACGALAVHRPEAGALWCANCGLWPLEQPC